MHQPSRGKTKVAIKLSEIKQSDTNKQGVPIHTSQTKLNKLRTNASKSKFLLTTSQLHISDLQI